MVVISSVVAVISVVSLYEHYSACNWQEVTSQTRNNLVFENRNQKYGAFVIRRDYDKKLMMILFSFILGIGALYSSYLYFKTPVNNSSMTSPNETEINYNFNIPPVDKVEPTKQKTEEPKEQKIETQKFVELIVKDEIVENDTSIIIDTKDIPIGLEATKGLLNPTVIINNPPSEPTVVKLPASRFPDIEAYFPGGEPARRDFLVTHTIFPPDGFDSEGGKCFLEFIVNSEGLISSVEVIKGVDGCKSCDREAIRVVKSMPKWKPALVNNKPVDSYFNMTINFLLE